MDANTTHHLVADMERLREHLGVRRWLLVGGSWGSTLILAYARRHPDKVSGVVISGVTTSRRTEIDWLYRGAGRFFPAEQERFRAHVPEASDELFGDDGVLAAYARRCACPDPDVRERAVEHWCAWENALLAHETNGRPGAFGAGRPPRDRLALVRICAHYFSHAAWLEEDELLRAAPRLGGIPSILVHGRLDLSCPLDTAWRLSKSWPGAELVVIEDSGHTGSPTMREQLQRACRDVADRASLL
jgi:proline iminopeptidase